MKLLDFEVGINQPFFLIAGPCVIESETLALETATYLQQVTEDLGINFIYKSSYDKANRTSTSSFRGLKSNNFIINTYTKNSALIIFV
jgi:2-dehydro-3-deoxyphosphooctonate aldolase (KDO 8-P synthase)